MANGRRLAALAVAAALTMAACSTADGGDDETTTSSGPTTTTTAPATTTTAPTPEATTFLVEVANVSNGFVARQADVFNTPSDADEPGPALPGSAYAWTFAAAPGERLSFATMFVQSNDWFFAPAQDGLALFDEEGQPVTGDVTDEILLFDSGTEIDETPGEGENQAPRQSGPDTGDTDPDNTVRQVADRTVSDYIAVTLDHDGSEFTITVDNVSEDADVPTPLAPGVAVVHSSGNPLFTEGAPDAGYGLEAIAEDGDPSGLAAWFADVTGVTGPLAPGVAVVDGTLFTAGAPDAGLGLEGLAEDGTAGPFGEAVGGVVFAVPSDGTEPGPAFPGTSYSFEVSALPGQTLNFATMLVQSNDWFFALGADGIALFDTDGAPIAGDITGSVSLWDAGTEIDQVPGVGADQAPRQAGPDTGADDENDLIRLVDGFDPADYVLVTITPQS